MMTSCSRVTTISSRISVFQIGVFQVFHFLESSDVVGNLKMRLDLLEWWTMSFRPGEREPRLRRTSACGWEPPHLHTML